MPCALVVPARTPRHPNCDRAREKVGWACEGERDSPAEAKGIDDGGEEVLEAVGAEVLL